MTYIATPQTMIIITLFSVIYLAYIFRKLSAGKIDLYDFIMLSTVAAIPAVFVLWPGFSPFIGKLFGVQLPMAVLFGGLFFVIFLLIHQLISKVHKLEGQNRLLVQELSLLKSDLKAEIKRD